MRSAMGLTYSRKSKLCDRPKYSELKFLSPRAHAENLDLEEMVVQDFRFTHKSRITELESNYQ